MPAPCGHISVGTADTFESLVEKQSGRRDVVGEGHFTRLQSLPQAIVRMPRPAKNRSVQKMYFWCPLVAVVFFFSKSYFSPACTVAGLSYAHTDRARCPPVFDPGTSTTLQCYVAALCKAAFTTACAEAPLVPRFLVVAIL